MAITIKLKHGLSANLANAIANVKAGEPLFCTDTGELLVGSANGAVKSIVSGGLRDGNVTRDASYFQKKIIVDAVQPTTPVDGDFWVDTSVTPYAFKIFKAGQGFQEIGALEASKVDYDNTVSGLTATNVQSAIDELKGLIVENSGDTGTKASQVEVDNIEAGAGLESDGTYLPDASTVYINGATSLKDADKKLDTAIDEVQTELTELKAGSTKTIADLDTAINDLGTADLNNLNLKKGGLLEVADDGVEVNSVLFDITPDTKDGLTDTGVAVTSVTETENNKAIFAFDSNKDLSFVATQGATIDYVLPAELFNAKVYGFAFEANNTKHIGQVKVEGFTLTNEADPNSTKTLVDLGTHTLTYTNNKAVVELNAPATLVHGVRFTVVSAVNGVDADILQIEVLGKLTDLLKGKANLADIELLDEAIDIEVGNLRLEIRGDNFVEGTTLASLKQAITDLTTDTGANTDALEATINKILGSELVAGDRVDPAVINLKSIQEELTTLKAGSTETIANLDTRLASLEGTGEGSVFDQIQDLEDELRGTDENHKDKSISILGAEIATLKGNATKDVGQLENDIDLILGDPDVDHNIVNLKSLHENKADLTYVNSIAQGIQPHAAVRVATTVALDVTANGAKVGKTLTANANGALVIDGVAVAVGDRVLVKNQANQMDNGIYAVTVVGDEATAFVLTRTATEDGIPDVELASGDFFFVQEGALSMNCGYVIINPPSGNVDVDVEPIEFTQFKGADQIVAGNGLLRNGNELEVRVDNSTIEIVADTLKVKDAGITNEKLATGIDATKIADGTVTNAEFQHLNGVDSNIQGQINTLSGLITDEAGDRADADLALHTKIDTLTLGKLADAPDVYVNGAIVSLVRDEVEGTQSVVYITELDGGTF